MSTKSIYVIFKIFFTAYPTKEEKIIAQKHKFYDIFIYASLTYLTLHQWDVIFANWVLQKNFYSLCKHAWAFRTCEINQ